MTLTSRLLSARSLRALAVVPVLLVTACGSSGQSAAPTSAAPAKPTTAATTAPAASAAPSPSSAPAAASPSPSAATAAKPAASAIPSPSAAASGPAISVNGPSADEAKALSGAGGTFPAPLYQKWFDEYVKVTQVQVNYQAIGSGGGIKGIQDRTVDFGASDAPMTDDQLKAAQGGEIFHIPTALGAIVPTYNLPENPNAKLKFTGDTLAGIFLGDIQKWNDPKLVADNPDLANVNQDIVVVHRSDGSGTTYGFTDYLSAVSPTWKQKVGKDTSVKWPVGLGGSGNAGVAGEVQQNPYSIGYVELIYALQNKLGYSMVKNKGGQFVDPSLAGVTAAAAASVQNIPADLRFSIVDAPGNDSYPISTATWMLVYRNYPDAAKGAAVARMMWWATHDGQKFNEALQFATVPEVLTSKSEAFLRQVSSNGTPVLK